MTAFSINRASSDEKYGEHKEDTSQHMYITFAPKVSISLQETPHPERFKLNLCARTFTLTIVIVTLRTHGERSPVFGAVVADATG